MKNQNNKIDFQLVNGFITTQSKLSQSVITSLKETGAVVQQIKDFVKNKSFFVISGNLTKCAKILRVA